MHHVPYRFIQNTTSFAHYWSKGVGKELLLQLGYVPDLERATGLIPLLYTWDNAADKVIIDLFEKVGFEAGMKSLDLYLVSKNSATEDVKVWHDFFLHIDAEPEWLDRKKLTDGSELCRRAGLNALIVLRDYCLMGGYESAAINKPLIYTGALKKGAAKRLTDTVEFWVQITKQDALLKPGLGYKHVLQTRMIHAFSRVKIIQKTDWDSHMWGIPLNNWDMLATQLGFSLVFLVGLRKMGISPSEQEIEGLFHMWKYIGYLLGIPIDILPKNELEAIEALFYWTMTQREGDDDTLALAKALLNEPVQVNYPKQNLMRKMMREVHLFYNYYFLGEYSCKMLGLPKTSIGQFARLAIWKTKRHEAKINEHGYRNKAILNGEKEQENVRKIYQEFNSI